MLSKLMKYDLKSMFKVFIPLWAALLVVSLVNRFTMDASSFESPQIISMLLYVFLFAAVIIVATVLIIMRFYNGLLKDEGYLMFTLPVKPWHLVISKCLSAVIIIFLSFIVGFASVCLIALRETTMMDVQNFFEELRSFWSMDYTLTVIFGIILAFVAILASITHIYASLAIGHLAPRHRIGWAVVAYIGINLLLTALGLLITNASHSFNATTLQFNSWTPMELTNLFMLILIAICVIQTIAFYIVTERILTKRLNLE